MKTKNLEGASLSAQDDLLDKTNMSIKRIAKIFDILLQISMIFTGLGLAVLIFAQVIMRYVLESPFAGTEEAAILLALWTYFLGMGYATKERVHIHGGIVNLIVSDPFKIQLIRFVGSIICSITACIFGYYACKYGFFVIEKGRMSLYLHWPKGLWSAGMIFGFVLMAGYFILQIVTDFNAMLDAKKQSKLISPSLKKDC
ncbi:TRAP transporter small permease [Psychromonas sp. Urea-02u-13]|uniref:TRAP transporter small permease n=1 Tax=Psychromonas sp. Urea-02u-13 TaxID=2058326 RepID=UPI000C349F4B|nr:TRAP transporter small permease subunit [Psychromonas sp. Urea-02u-13]PKG37988.1 TRAP transporter small permease [Psychromonas sp. Urea-02u-13]